MYTSLAIAAQSTTVDDQRNFERIHETLAGTLFVQNVSHRCIAMNISPSGARVKCGHAISLDTSVRLHVDGFGSFESYVIHCEDGELGLLFADRDARRFQIIDKLAQFVECGTTSPRQARRHERTPANAFCYFTLADGYLVQCYILDISLQGMSIKVLIRPPIGEIVSFGGTHGRVTRHHDQGVVIQFMKESAEQLTAGPVAKYRPPKGLYMSSEWP